MDKKYIEESVLPWLGRTMKFVDYYIMDKFKEYDIELTKVQMILLHRLNENDGQPQNNLAFITDRDKASLTRLLDTMERKNLVARIPSKSDGRVNNIHITKTGKKVLEECAPVISEIIQDIQSGFSRQEIKQFIGMLKNIQENIKNDELVALQTK